MLEPLQLGQHVPLADALRLIDEATERQEAYVLTLKSQRNTLVPIACLPSEILSRIFSFVQADSGNDVDKCLLRLTHISRYWRNVAIASPTLWTFIDNPLLCNLPWLKTILDRSQARLTIKAEVDLLYNYDYKSLSAGLKLVLQHSQRIYHLSIIGVDAKQWRQLQSMLLQAAPQLEHLYLERGRYRIPGPAFGLQEVLSETPKLRRLELINFTVNWASSSHFNHTLVYLKLDDTLPHRTTWQQFADILKRMPNLEVLDLKNGFPDHKDGQVSGASSPIHFASLQYLLIGSYLVKDVKSFLSCVTFPSTTKVKITCSVIDDFEELRNDLSGLLAALPHSFLNTPSDTYVQTLILYQDSKLGFRLKLYTDALTDAQMLDHKHIIPCLELFARWSIPSSREQDLLDVANIVYKSALPLQNIRHVYLADMLAGSNPSALANTVGKLRHLSSVLVAQNAHKILVDALQLGLAAESAEQRRTIFFPNLSSIYLSGDAFPEEPRTHHAGTLKVKTLHDAFALRDKAGAKIEKLTVGKGVCRRLGKGGIDLLKKVVHEVVGPQGAR